ncbi:MAG: ABC transporter permease [Spirochaetae bacterium HGW-Spirochaetae-5]|nr:MAG: ABC transporter permease [Spirochaetae bacterium HGW-Spirochaetae-5]
MDISFFAAAVVAGTPLLYAILGELITEKSGQLNLGVEGMMLMGAVIGFKMAIITGNPYLALLGAMAAGGFGAIIYAVLTVTFRANQVVSGLTLTIFGTGFASFMGQGLMGEIVPPDMKLFFADFKIPFLGDIPILGQIFFNQGILVYSGYLLTIIAGLYIYRTQIGLNLRAVGENTAAADAAGIHVSLYKYVHVIIGGVLCGLAGAYLSLVYIPSWQENVTAGRGWIAVALVIFCKWNPYRVMMGAFLFGGLDIIGFRIQKFDIHISQYIIDLLPYIVTIVILILVSVRKSHSGSAPASLGVSYFREER